MLARMRMSFNIIHVMRSDISVSDNSTYHPIDDSYKTEQEYSIALQARQWALESAM